MPEEAKRKREEPPEVEAGTALAEEGSAPGESQPEEALVPVKSKMAAQEEPDRAQEQRAKKAKKTKKAQYWYYNDLQGGQLQGPFYPGQMSQWLAGGFFPTTLPVAPSFHGEVPQEVVPIHELFDAPLSETAFVPGPGIANMPPEEQAAPEPEKEYTKADVERMLMGQTGPDFKICGKFW